MACYLKAQQEDGSKSEQKLAKNHNSADMLTNLAQQDWKLAKMSLHSDLYLHRVSAVGGYMFGEWSLLAPWPVARELLMV